MQLEPKWLVIYTSPRHEKRVSKHLQVREIEHYLPLYRTQRKWADGSRVTLDLPLFPGYLFVLGSQTSCRLVLRVPGVLAIVSGVGHEPALLPDNEINALRCGLHLRHPEPHPLLETGRLVRIRSGPLAGMSGIVVRKKNNFRVVITVEFIMQSVSVEVDRAELESLDSEKSN
jgi:transcription antitermination factor NusG